MARVARGNGKMLLVAEAFVIMQIGNPVLDDLYTGVMVPALTACGLVPRRIDMDNEGGLLNAEIMASIESSDIIVADLTNERPNCYLEVGYALGLGRQRNLILTVRQDHLPGHPNHVIGGPRVHFDLAGYDLLIWRPEDLDAFGTQLEERVRRRLALMAGTRPSQAGIEQPEPWFTESRNVSIHEIQETVGPGFMEIYFELDPPKIERRQSDLLDAAQHAQIRTFGWPIGLVLNRDEDRPHPTGHSIRARVASNRIDGQKTFDYWELRTDGDFFTIMSLFEDQRGHIDQLFLDTRVIRITEALLFAGRLYDRLEVRPDHKVRITVRHGGLQGRQLVAANQTRYSAPDARTHVDETVASVTFAIGELGAQLVDLVESLATPLFELFDFFQLDRPTYESIVDRFVRGQIS
jgi:hypothetical protein